MNVDIFIEEAIEVIFSDKDGLKKIILEEKIEIICNENFYYEIFKEFLIKLIEFFCREEAKFNDVIKKNFIPLYYKDYIDNQRFFLMLISDVYSVNLKKIKNAEIEYLNNGINKIFLDFADNYWHKKYQKYGIRIGNAYNLKKFQKIDGKKFINNGKEIIYLDTNVFSELIDNTPYYKDIILSKNIYQYCTSAYINEDLVKGNLLFRGAIVKVIENITDNLNVHREGDFPKMDIMFAYENQNSIFARVELWKKITFYREKNEYSTYQINFGFNKIKETIKNYNSEEMLHYLYANKDTFKKTILEQDFEIIFNEQNSMYQKISSLINILNFLGFKTDKIKEKNKVYSSYQDKEHLLNAWKCDIFVTSDLRLIERAKLIYGFFNIEIKVENLKNFIEFIG
ncbi:hypothetical protein [Acinetobacter bereziniae]|uniref:hypothetical protein n=1 Tax=Acinetobacter bereziniae TaxID=106648 RepID=UPI003AF9ED00